MARICIAEPVAETRVLLERLVRKLGHDVVGPDDGPDAVLTCADEPGAPASLVHPFSPADLRRALDTALAA